MFIVRAESSLNSEQINNQKLIQLLSKIKTKNCGTLHRVNVFEARAQRRRDGQYGANGSSPRPVCVGPDNIGNARILGQAVFPSLLLRPTTKIAFVNSFRK